MKDQSEGMYFVQVREPTEVRKHVLETLKQIFEMLQRLEKMRQLRHEKLQNIEKLRSLFKSANKLVAALKLKLPQTNLRIAPAKESSHHKKSAGKKSKTSVAKEKMEPAPQRQPSDAEKLEAQLNAIESKLRSLT